MYAPVRYYIKKNKPSNISMATRQPQIDESYELDTFSAMDQAVDAASIRLPIFAGSAQRKADPTGKYEFKKEAESLIFFTQPPMRIANRKIL